jgi:hypothetical protein
VSKLSAKGWKNLVAKDKDKIKHHRHEIQVLAGETGLEIGEFRKPAIMVSRPALMRLAMAISPSRESSSTEPISRRYMRIRRISRIRVVSVSASGQHPQRRFSTKDSCRYLKKPTFHPGGGEVGVAYANLWYHYGARCLSASITCTWIFSAFFIMSGLEGVRPRLTPRTWATFPCGFLSAIVLVHLLLDR